MKKRIAVLLSGCGVYDGSEIHESVCTLLAIEKRGGETVCLAPNIPQHHVINHLNGEEMEESRNVLIESARIARGEIVSLEKAKLEELDALVIPGGFGTAKNHTKWAFSGSDGEIVTEVKDTILHFVQNNKPVMALCMGPTTVAKALADSGIVANLSVGTTEEPSPYDITGISGGMQKTGMKSEMKSVREVLVDTGNKIISAPCYMMEASLVDVMNNVEMAADELFKLLKS